MVDPDFLDLLEGLARSLKNSELPFGGIQVVFAGDIGDPHRGSSSSSVFDGSLNVTAQDRGDCDLFAK
jgi:hypothetical protein